MTISESTVLCDVALLDQGSLSRIASTFPLASHTGSYATKNLAAHVKANRIKVKGPGSRNDQVTITGRIIDESYTQNIGGKRSYGDITRFECKCLLSRWPPIHQIPLSWSFSHKNQLSHLGPRLHPISLGDWPPEDKESVPYRMRLEPRDLRSNDEGIKEASFGPLCKDYDINGITIVVLTTTVSVSITYRITRLCQTLLSSSDSKTVMIPSLKNSSRWQGVLWPATCRRCTH